MKVDRTIEIKPTHIVVDAGVRYWEDALVDGVEDVDGALIPGRSEEPGEHHPGISPNATAPQTIAQATSSTTICNGLIYPAP